ncbi:MAG: hypothetical protein MJ096_00870 [Clostridia bacterium]|nr:hypothetical protein [Clostridia bacterium]
MVRGCEKRIYYVKNTESELFDEAYLILRRGKGGVGSCGGDMEAEARRIVNGMTNGGEGKRGKGRLYPFLAGMASGIALAGGTTLIIALIP